jgi:branched-chain amino acid aminotransferase
MPVLPEALFIQAVEELVKIDKDWVPSGAGSLYLRPFMFSSEAFLGVRPAQEYIFCVIACPVGPYFKGGDKPLKLWVSDKYTRAAPGGTGAAKCGGNYAASLIAQAEATEHGCDQVVFLDAAEHRWIEELGGMNLFFVMADGSMVTPPLTGTILPGITRTSIISIARDMGMKVSEAPYSMDQWRSDAESGKLTEAFACGTAAVVASIGEVVSSSGSFKVKTAQGATVASKLKEQLVGIQKGNIADSRGWVRKV